MKLWRPTATPDSAYFGTQGALAGSLIAILAIAIPFASARADLAQQIRATDAAVSSAREQSKANQIAVEDSKRQSELAQQDAADARTESAALRGELESIRKQMEMDGAVIRVSGALYVWWSLAVSATPFVGGGGVWVGVAFVVGGSC